MDNAVIMWIIGAAASVVIFLSGVVGFVFHIYISSANQRFNRNEKDINELFKLHRRTPENTNDNEQGLGV